MPPKPPQNQPCAPSIRTPRSDPVPVIFRMLREGSVVALFPSIPWDIEGIDCVSYTTIGQHSGASYNGVMARSRAATNAEFADLYLELRKLGYRLKIVSRDTPAIRMIRRRKANQF